jgi:hypothetical protein
VWDDEELPTDETLADEESPVPAGFVMFSASPKASVTLDPAKIVTGVGTQFTLTAEVDDSASGSHSYVWSINPAIASQQGSCAATCTFTAGQAGGKASVTVRVTDGAGNGFTSDPVRVIVVQITSAQAIVPATVGSDMTMNFNTPIPASGPLQWPGTLWSGATPLIMIRDSVDSTKGVPIRVVTVPPVSDSEMPANVIGADVQRAPDDVTGFCEKTGCTASDVPIVYQPSLGLSTLIPDETGSFQVLAFVDTNGNGVWDQGETGISLPLILVQAVLHQNESTAPVIGVTYQPTTTNEVWDGTFIYTGGAQHFECGLPGHADQCASDLKAEVDLIGGGDGTRGTGFVYGGWVQNLTSDQDLGTYQNGHFDKGVFASNIASTFNPSLHIFLPGDPDPIPVALPLIDLSLESNGLPLPLPGSGGNTSIEPFPPMTYSATAPVVGRRIVVESIDAPNTYYQRYHQKGADSLDTDSRLTQITYSLTFCDYLVLWTSATGETDASGTPPPTGSSLAERTYAVVLQQSWSIASGFNVDPNGAGTGSGTVTVDPNAALSYQPVLPFQQVYQLFPIQPVLQRSGGVLVPPRVLDVAARNVKQ